jgi:hypothetical protein
MGIIHFLDHQRMPRRPIQIQMDRTLALANIVVIASDLDVKQMQKVVHK